MSPDDSSFNDGLPLDRGPETIQAKDDTLRQLVQLTAKVPFDDRRNLQTGIESISPSLVRRFLHDVGSDLVQHDPPLGELQIYRHLNLLMRINGHEVPRNVALLFFSEDPDRFFPGARIEVVQFGDDAGGDLIEERIFRGPIPDQIRSVLNYLDSLGGTLLRKVPGQAEVERTVPYPYEAMEEALVNAVYHRSYEEPPEPVKVYLYPDRMEITSYPGPVPGIRREHFQPGSVLPPVPSRNRRIGDFLKELRLAERRGTGIPKIQRKMRENGSPEAHFDFDESHTYFRAILPVHPRYQVIQALRESAHLWVTGEKQPALQLLERTLERQPDSPALATQIIEYALSLGDELLAYRALERFESAGGNSARPFLALARFLVDRDRIGDAARVLERVAATPSIEDTVEAAVLRRRAQDFEGAHRLFAEAYSLQPDDPRLVQQYARTKMGLAHRLGPEADPQVKKRLNREAAELLRKAIQLADDPALRARSWVYLALALDRLEASRGEIEAAFQAAVSLLPDEPWIQDQYEAWRTKTEAGAR